MTEDQIKYLRDTLTAATPGAWGTAFVSLPAPDVAALLDKLDRLTAERDAAFRRGFNAMREIANERLEVLDYLSAAHEVRAIPTPEDR